MTDVCLTLIVKNEAATIALTLESARKALGPGPTVVVDTGSTDDTVNVIRDRWPGVNILHRPFDDFASSRNFALAKAWELSPLACMVDAGVIVRGRLTLASPEVSPYTANIRLGSLVYTRPQIFPAGWKYFGRVHEYAEGPGKLAESGLTFSYELKDEERGRRWVRDLALLEDDFSPRGRFYYAQTLELLGRRSQAIKAYEERYAMTDGFWQERVIAMIRCISLARTRDDAERYAMAALQLDPSRGEAWLALCKWAEDDQNWAWLKHCAGMAILAVPRSGALFVDIDREWRANVYAGDAESSRGNFVLARQYWARALEIEGGRMAPADRDQLRFGVKLNAHDAPPVADVGDYYEPDLGGEG